MLQTQHLYSHQQQYNQHEPSPWQHTAPQSNLQGLSHSTQQQQQTQAQAAAAAAAAAQQQHYNRIAINQSHNQNPNRQSSGDNAPSSLGSSINNIGEQTSQAVMDQQLSEENRKVLQWVAELMDPMKREAALMELSKKREQVPELALVLWHSFGVMTSLLQEIISVYPLLNPSQLTAPTSNRVCNALALLQCVASHNETRGLFLNG